ncbi:MAG: DUF1810 domain-containing protein [Ferruginibacter sp.]
MKRFIDAQETKYPLALAEIKSGRKQSHWMWYIFPQIQGLGLSDMSKRYAIKDLSEAEAFLEHPLLGSRLIEICTALLALPGNDAYAIFGSPDNAKLKSSMTLFSLVNNTDPVFQQVLDKFFKGVKDLQTIQIINGA